MQVNDLKLQIVDNKLDSFYVFTGDEWKIQQLYINEICKVTGKEYRYVPTLSSVWLNITNKSLFSKPSCYVIRDDYDLIRNESITLDKSTLKDNIVILLLTDVDKRTKFYKKYKDRIIDFEHLNPEMLKRYLQKDINLSDKNCYTLMDICDYNYGRCLLEIDKIKHHAKATQAEDMSNNVFELLLFDGTINVPPKDAIFDLIDAILDADYNLSIKLYNECIQYGESIMVMLSVLYTNAKQLLQVQSYDGNNLEKATGLTKWQINNAKKHLNVFSNVELVDIMRLCQHCERGIKLGEIPDEYAMKYIFSKIEW